MLRLFLVKCNGQTRVNSSFHNFAQSFRFICLRSSNSSKNGMKSVHNNDFLVTVSSFPNNSPGLLSTTSPLPYASEIARLQTSQKPNSVVQFFQSHGLSQSQITIIFRRYPPLFLSNVQETLKPKMDFFLSLGISQTDLNKIITGAPLILFRSLKNHLIPSIEMLKMITGGEGNALTAIKRNPLILRHCRPKFWAQNVAALRKFNVPYSRVSKFVTMHPGVITKLPSQFSNVVSSLSTIWEMGFNPSSSAFILAVTAMARGNDLSWNKKFENFRSLGFSDHEILSMFKKQPLCMLLSRGRVKVVVDFYLNNLHWSPMQLSIRPNVLLYSLEKRIIPRCSVLQILWSRNMFDNSPMTPMLLTILIMTEKNFLQKYVTKYKDEVPEAMDAYQGKLNFDEYNFGSKEIEKETAL